MLLPCIVVLREFENNGEPIEQLFQTAGVPKLEDTLKYIDQRFRIAHVTSLSRRMAIVYFKPTNVDKEYIQDWGKQMEVVQLFLSPVNQVPAFPLPPEHPADPMLRIAIADEAGLLRGDELQELV